MDANVLFQSFPRYLLLRLHENEICQVKCSRLIWKECAKKLQIEFDKIDDAKIEEIEKEIEERIGGLLDLSSGSHPKKIAEVFLPDLDDRHVLYLAAYTSSHFLVTDNLADFPEMNLLDGKNKYLKLRSDFEVVSCDSFFCTLIQEEIQELGTCTKFLVALAETISVMRNHSVSEILKKLGKENNCPDTYTLLEPQTKRIEVLVELQRQNLSKNDRTQ